MARKPWHLFSTDVEKTSRSQEDGGRSCREIVQEQGPRSHYRRWVDCHGIPRLVLEGLGRVGLTVLCSSVAQPLDAHHSCWYHRLPRSLLSSSKQSHGHRHCPTVSPYHFVQRLSSGYGSSPELVLFDLDEHASDAAEQGPTLVLSHSYVPQGRRV